MIETLKTIAVVVGAGVTLCVMCALLLFLWVVYVVAAASPLIVIVLLIRWLW